MEEHKNFVRSTYPGKYEAWITLYYVDTSTSWLQQWFLVNDMIDEQLSWLATGPSVSILTFQGHEINGYTFYIRAKTKRTPTKIVVSI